MKHARKVKISSKRARISQQASEDVDGDSADDDYNPSSIDSDDDDEEGCIDDDLSVVDGDEMEFVKDDYQPF